MHSNKEHTMKDWFTALTQPPQRDSKEVWAGYYDSSRDLAQGCTVREGTMSPAKFREVFGFDCLPDTKSGCPAPCPVL
jgi:hypothetical protein